MNTNKKILFAALVILTATVFVYFAFTRRGGEPGVLVKVGEYTIMNSDVIDKVAFDTCLGRAIDPTRALGVLLYGVFLENVKIPLNTDVRQTEIDGEYNNLENKKNNSFMNISQEALDCINAHFAGKRAILDKIIIRPALLEVAVQQAYIAEHPADGSVGTTTSRFAFPSYLSEPKSNVPVSIQNAPRPAAQNDYYAWYTGYLKSNVKILIYSQQVCAQVKLLYGTSWFKDTISC